MHLGLVVGKFMPPTLGHKYLIEFARRQVDELVVIAGSDIAEGSIPVEVRVEWLQRHFGGAVRVFGLDVPDLAAVSDYAAFAESWRSQVIATLDGRPPDALFASEAYGALMAAVLQCRFVEVDAAREIVPISATEVRRCPVRHWDLILPEARAHFVRRLRFVHDDVAVRRAVCAAMSARLGITCVEETAIVRGAGSDREPWRRLAAAESAAATVARGAVLLCVSSAATHELEAARADETYEAASTGGAHAMTIRSAEGETPLRWTGLSGDRLIDRLAQRIAALLGPSSPEA